MSEIPQQDVYIDNPRDDVMPHLDLSGVRSALDVGCGRGGFGRALRERLGEGPRIVGVEPVAEQAARAREGHGFDEVYDGYFPAALGDPGERFDLISFNDVLEHIVDPWTVLRQTRDHVSPTGRVVAAIPSIRYAPVVWQLVRGRWDYADTGTLDRTHVRFFTRATMVEMFEDCGYVVHSAVGLNPLGVAWPTDPLAPRRWLKAGIRRALGDAAYLHFLVVASPDPAYRPG